MDISIRKESSHELSLLRIIYEMDKRGEQATLWSILAVAEQEKCIRPGTDEDNMNNYLRDMAMKGLITTKQFEHSKDGHDLTIFPTVCGIRALRLKGELQDRNRTLC
jgi:hypothetical protein